LRGLVSLSDSQTELGPQVTDREVAVQMETEPLAEILGPLEGKLLRIAGIPQGGSPGERNLPVAAGMDCRKAG
jgi:hypothetical protein